MDKKSKYQQPCAKGAAVDAKKSQDVISSKLFPKSSRRRESPSANSFPKNDQPRKSNAQKTKNFDKRPKLKGHYHGGSKEDSKVVENETAEFGSVMVQGSKKQNLNHLLNFHYESRDMQGGWNQAGTHGYNSYNYNRWLPAVQRHKYNKEQFLQANCQFVVTAKGDYSLYLNDPDILVDWKLIEQIRVHSSDNLSCPICLCPPLAGKMTRCGHVYCWPCILHYLALSNNSWRKCPICYESVNKSDLKSVVEITESALNIGDEVTLRLMRREKGTLLAVPVDDSVYNPSKFLPISENSSRHVYSKLLTAENNDVMNIIEQERFQLNFGLLEDPHSPENCFIEQALSELLIREQQLLVTNVPAQNKVKEQQQQQQQQQQQPTLCDENLEHNAKTNVEGVEGVEGFKMPDNLLAETNGRQNKSQFHYFYQAEDGQNVYLHAMNVKMLEMQYGGLERCPRLILGKLIEKEVGSLTEDLRRRMRYLGHLPLTSQFETVELDLKPPTVSWKVLRYFEDQISSRKQKRKHREREERRREKKITEEENKRMGKYPKPTVHIQSHKHFPQFLPGADELNGPSTSSAASSPSSSSFNDDVISEIAGAVRAGSSMPSEQGPSFAEMLRNNVSKKTSVWPSLGGSRDVSVKEAANTGTGENDACADDYELNEWIPPPAYSRSLGDALADALEQSELLGGHGNKPADNNGTSSRSNNNNNNNRKKKKKGKATLLYTTDMARTS